MGRIKDTVYSVSEKFELPSETVAAVPKVTVTGRKRVLIENHRGLLLLSEELIQVKGGRVSLGIRGNGLQLCVMNKNEMLITGTVTGVELD